MTGMFGDYRANSDAIAKAGKDFYKSEIKKNEGKVATVDL